MRAAAPRARAGSPWSGCRALARDWSRPAPRAPGRSTARHRRSRVSGSPPMPMFPSASSTVPHRPSPGTRSCTSRSSANRRGLGSGAPPRGSGPRPAPGCPRRPTPRRTGPVRSRCRALVPRTGTPPPRRPRSAAPTAPASSSPAPRNPAACSLPSATRISTGTPDSAASNSVAGEHGDSTSRRCRRPNRVSRRHAATGRRVGRLVHVTHRRQQADARARALQPVELVARRCARSTSARRGSRRGRDRRKPDRPVPAVAREPEHRVVALPVARRGRPPAAAGCPSRPAPRSTGRPPSARRRPRTRGPAARRGVEPRCGRDAYRRRQPRHRRPVPRHAPSGRAPGVGHGVAACPGWPPPPVRPPRAGMNVGFSRVLTRPGDRRLRQHDDDVGGITGHRPEHRGHVPDRPAAPSGVPGDLGPAPPRRSSRPPPLDHRQPASAARTHGLHRIPGPAVPDPEGEQRPAVGPTRIGPMSASAQPGPPAHPARRAPGWPAGAARAGARR